MNKGKVEISCFTCTWFVRDEFETTTAKILSGIGDCRRHAPVVQRGHPKVFDDHWCGEYLLSARKKHMKDNFKRNSSK